MKKAIIGFLIAGCICTAIGIGVFCVSLAMGFQIREIPLLIEERGWSRMIFINRWSVFNNWDNDWILDDADFTTETFAASDIKRINVDMAIGEFEIRRASSEEVRVEAGQSFSRYAKVELHGDTLTIENHNKRYRTKAIMYLPDEMILDDIKIRVDAGTAGIDFLKTKNLDVRVAAGELRGDNISCESSVWTVAAGSIRVDDLTSSDISFSCQAGSIEAKIRGEKDDYQGEIKSDLGSISIDGSEHHSLSSDMRIGSSNSPKTLDADCAVGQIEIRFIDSK